MDSLFEKRHYPYALYLGHLALEKILKSYYVKKIDKAAPYSHNLLYLAERCKLLLSENHKDLLEVVTRFNIEARYPDVKFRFYRTCTKKFTQKYIVEIKEFYKWLRKQI
ncbi:MAG TPA: HEPN domain-containing protein [bacterium (Candidatus Stahlbacteria)]|nr:HEPN domain-containing protein [Candidatus Stahlbacteria bacterium]